jgi:hypothetical protein
MDGHEESDPRLSVYNSAYAVLYAQCKLHFPKVAQELVKPAMFQWAASVSTHQALGSITVIVSSLADTVIYFNCEITSRLANDQPPRYFGMMFI